MNRKTLIAMAMREACANAGAPIGPRRDSAVGAASSKLLALLPEEGNSRHPDPSPSAHVASATATVTRCDLDLDALEKMALDNDAPNEHARPWDVHYQSLVKRANPSNEHVATSHDYADYIATFDPPTVLKLIAAAKSGGSPAAPVKSDGLCKSERSR